ncbi:MAG: nuclear transport factor 2 family protein, partial [Candidatus Hodarchaeota archaeon]
WSNDGIRMVVDSTTNAIRVDSSPSIKENFDNRIQSPDLSQHAEIESIDWTGSAGSARVIWYVQSANGVTLCVDYLLLLKVNGSWKIVGKVSHFENSA